MEEILSRFLSTEILTETTIFSAIVWLVITTALNIRRTSIYSVILVTCIVPVIALLVNSQHPIVNTVLTSLSLIGLYGILRTAKTENEKIANLIQTDERKNSRHMEEETTTTTEEHLSEDTNGHYTLSEKTVTRRFTIEDDTNEEDE